MSSEPVYSDEYKAQLYEDMNQKLTRREKRELGILPRQLFFECRDMSRDGLISEEDSWYEVSILMCHELMNSSRYGAAWNQIAEGTYGFDWEQFRLLIEMILQWLAEFLPLFI